MHTGARHGSSDEGETLIELIIAVAIMGITVVAIVGGMATTVLMSDVHRKQATAGAYVRNYAEALQGSYVSCTSPETAPNYADSLAAPSGFNTPTTTVQFWDSTSASFKFWDGASASFTTSSSIDCPGTDPGLQLVTLTLASTDSRAAESLAVVLRKP
jgi:type II secretory pathway pseudopilin PulG